MNQPHHNPGYRGRLAPSPTGLLHLGHARTFRTCVDRAAAADGLLVLRIEDLDPQRCKPEFIDAVYEDFAWLGFHWDEGPFLQSQRRHHYLRAWHHLRDNGFIYPCHRSRKDVREAASAPHEEHGLQEPIFPTAWRADPATARHHTQPAGLNWRFRVPDDRVVAFTDHLLGPQHFVAGHDFGDFVVWRRDNIPAYELAVVVDDHAMRINEVVRGRDLLLSTARQLLLYEALGHTPPHFAHTQLLHDASGQRLAKRHHALALRTLRQQGLTPDQAFHLHGTPNRR